jgi:hypothetical protein
MAVVIPIISEFDGKGLSKAIKEFKQLETSGEKAQFALKKAAVPAAAALAGVAFAIGDATKAAVEDAKAQELLALAITKNTSAGEANVKVAESYIEKTMMSAAVADDVLRPALGNLVQSTGDLTFAQDLLNTALDISAATGQDLTTVTDALSKAAVGNTKALGNLVPSVRDNIKAGESLDQIMKELSVTVGGAAATAANSAEGQMKRLSLTIAETKESIGAAFLPILEKLLPKLQSFAAFAQENTTLITALIVSVGALSAAILVLNTAIKAATAAQIAFNFALTANPIGIVVVAIAGIVASFALLINKTGSVINAFKYMGNSIVMVFEGIANAFNFMLNGIVSAINLIPGVSVPLIPKVVLPKFSFTSPGSGSVSGSSGITAGPDLLERSLIKAIPAGGPAVSVAPPTAPRSGGGGSAATGGAAAAGFSNLPPSGLQNIGISSSGALIDFATGQLVNDQRQLPDTINITINAAVAEASLGDKIVEALTDYNRRSGPLDLQIAV